MRISCSDLSKPIYLLNLFSFLLKCKQVISKKLMDFVYNQTLFLITLNISLQLISACRDCVHSWFNFWVLLVLYYSLFCLPVRYPSNMTVSRWLAIGQSKGRLSFMPITIPSFLFFYVSYLFKMLTIMAFHNFLSFVNFVF